MLPEEWVGQYNVRTAFTFDIRKSQPNTSRILFYDVPKTLRFKWLVQMVRFKNLIGVVQLLLEDILKSVDFTYGRLMSGQVNFIELSYLESE